MVATLDPDKRRVEQGLALMVVAPTVIWTARVVAIGAIGPGAPEWVWRELPWIGALGFAIGWIVVGGALRPAGSAARGVALALLLYAIAGVVWTFALQLSFGRPLLDIATDRSVLLFGLQWPLQIAQVTGAFGLGY